VKHDWKKMSEKKLRGGYLIHINENVYMHIEKRKETGLRKR